MAAATERTRWPLAAAALLLLWPALAGAALPTMVSSILRSTLTALQAHGTLLVREERLVFTHVLWTLYAQAHFEPRWRTPPYIGHQEAASLLNRQIEAAGIALFIDSLRPTHPHYRQLRGALAAYRGMAAAGGWREIPTGPVIEKGDVDARVPLIRQRLARSGDLPAPCGDCGDRFDEALEEAVARFQDRHRVVLFAPGVDDRYGAVGEETRHHMNLPVEARVDHPASIDWQRYSGATLPYRLVEPPGPSNPVGRIKFIFPNPDFVFMHDTPEKRYFDHERRDFSAGCVRIERPFELAAHLMRLDGQVVEDRLERMLASGRTIRVHFARPVPVILLYGTVSVDDQGRVVFRDDIYDRDSKLLRALNAPVRLWDVAAGR